MKNFNINTLSTNVIKFFMGGSKVLDKLVSTNVNIKGIINVLFLLLLL